MRAANESYSPICFIGDLRLEDVWRDHAENASRNAMLSRGFGTPEKPSRSAMPETSDFTAFLGFYAVPYRKTINPASSGSNSCSRKGESAKTGDS
jgi:hypothetical protein